MFVALEGADGSGKTTLCAALAKHLEATAYATPPKKYLSVREEVDRIASAEEHYRFYRDGIFHASREIEVMLQSGNGVVADRYWLSTYTYHQVMGASVSREDFSCVVQPDLTIILALNHDVQIERILRRGMSAGDRRLIGRQQEITAAFYMNALAFSLPFIVVDTHRFSPEECIKVACSTLLG